ncbi:uncharacterized protein LY89DRAFT_690160 [Mollisia scopiformis]|uniref:Uncharacterized protein n=1 Tax=Mollisia scopiformis TaxID=149040 RepID=A0A132BCL2_MOLSC|nr:uncharacterized protein LY89DRAFT_690160 [Mollisia scopiformis]KUJ09739.1 hypothetical protein LY89DRAFT_690160 [Mollisia scopiformis]
MDLFEELERMAQNATAFTDAEPDGEDVERWVHLFKYDYLEAYALFKAQRSDVTREPISDEHWALVKDDREAAGFDREAYEHSLTLKDVLKSHSTVIHDKDGRRWTLFRLGGLLESREKVKEIAELDELPKVTQGEGQFDTLDFVWVDDEARGKIETWMQLQQVVEKGKVEKDS